MSFETTKHTLLSRARKKEDHDAAEWNELVKMYYSPMLGFLIRLAVNREMAEDVLQEFFLGGRFHKAVRSYALDEGKFRSWLMLYLKCFWRDDLRKLHAQKRDLRLNVSADDPDTRAAMELIEDREAEVREQAEAFDVALRRALADYPAPEHLPVFWDWLNREKGETAEQVAERHGISLNRLNYIVRRVLEHLRRRLEGVKGEILP